MTEPPVPYCQRLVEIQSFSRLTGRVKGDQGGYCLCSQTIAVSTSPTLSTATGSRSLTETCHPRPEIVFWETVRGWGRGTPYFQERLEVELNDQ